jgi:hypothetical protein
MKRAVPLRARKRALQIVLVITWLQKVEGRVARE